MYVCYTLSYDVYGLCLGWAWAYALYKWWCCSFLVHWRVVCCCCCCMWAAIVVEMPLINEFWLLLFFFFNFLLLKRRDVGKCVLIYIPMHTHAHINMYIYKQIAKHIEALKLHTQNTRNTQRSEHLETLQSRLKTLIEPQIRQQINCQKDECQMVFI